MSYKAMKDKLKKVFTSNNLSTTTDHVKLENPKSESAFYSNDKEHIQHNYEIVLYSRGHYQPRGGRTPRRGGGNLRASYNFNGNLRHTNPPDENGEVSRCAICDSVFHWANKCPHSYEALRKKSTDNTHNPKGVKNL